MLNGSGLNPGFYSDLRHDDGHSMPASHIFLPYPDSDSLIALFHHSVDTVDVYGNYVPSYLYYTLLDMTLDNGKGAVVQKNVILLSGQFTRCGVSAVRHGNGRDWWIVFHQNGTDVFVQFLLTAAGVDGPYFQVAGVVRAMGLIGSAFSMDGSRFAFMEAYDDLDVFDFDRCSGC